MRDSCSGLSMFLYVDRHIRPARKDRHNEIVKKIRRLLPNICVASNKERLMVSSKQKAAVECILIEGAFRGS